MSLTDEQRLSRFAAYAAAFEAAFDSDDWTVLEPFFTEDASSELNGTRVEGRSAVLRSFRDAVTMFDRRFDRRALRFVEGPVVEDGVVRLKAVARYERRGLPALEVVGEEWFHFAGDRIQRHVDQVLNLDEVMGYVAQHGESLRPVAAASTAA
jgi:hypothetical protein